MKAIARRQGQTFTHRVDVRHHHVTCDEPPDLGGDDEGPNPQELLAASLAACTAITMEMYARRKDWDIGPIEVEVVYESSAPGSATHFDIVLRVSRELSAEQVERLRIIAAKCPVHRTLAGEVSFDERIELVGAVTG